MNITLEEKTKNIKMKCVTEKDACSLFTLFFEVTMRQNILDNWTITGKESLAMITANKQRARFYALISFSVQNTKTDWEYPARKHSGCDSKTFLSLDSFLMYKNNCLII